MKVVCIIQARVGSTRLPAKVIMDICGKTVLEHDIDRLKEAKEINQIIIATTDRDGDIKIKKEADRLGVVCFRGSEEDVLSRYYLAAKESNADIIIRVTSDCPLIDPNIIDDMIKFYKKNNYEVVTNTGLDIENRTFPRGLDAEIFSFRALENAHLNATEKYQKEHVTPYIYQNNELIYIYKNDIDYSRYRLTLDTVEDFEVIEKIYKHFYKINKSFYLNDIVNFMNNNPEIYEINKHIEQKKI